MYPKNSLVPVAKPAFLQNSLGKLKFFLTWVAGFKPDMARLLPLNVLFFLLAAERYSVQILIQIHKCIHFLVQIQKFMSTHTFHSSIDPVHPRLNSSFIQAI
ncbi:hypothetical protein KSP39_PZI022850 [Platanthera zijinensis]|uniref:Uncharacterized protein n=1 Tax=Platanthera zijinensis TaxID=2320716 RepID=A0AAP0AVZ0_9ASPA